MTPENELLGGLKIAASAGLFIGFVLTALIVSGQVPL
jgi:tetrahydromethanopterin S-methyltransferase subunit F